MRTGSAPSLSWYPSSTFTGTRRITGRQRNCITDTEFRQIHLDQNSTDHGKRGDRPVLTISEDEILTNHQFWSHEKVQVRREQGLSYGITSTTGGSKNRFLGVHNSKSFL